MAFYCQRNCYEKELVSQVVSCKPVNIEDIRDEIKKSFYEVTFKDTVFFPEGGGQPYDTGFINDNQVFKVLRRGGEAVHFVENPLELNTEVNQVVNWTRRHDHMQQHSAQHLISAVAEQHYDSPTYSWNLGEKISSIEFDNPKITTEQMRTMEEHVNREIRKALPVITNEYEAGDPKLKQFHTRGLPSDATGPIRVVTIEGIDCNMCCGTHVSNLADIQAIKLLYTEKGKSNKTLLYFVAGKRVLRYLEECFTRERTMNGILHSNPDEHIRLIEKSRKDLKQSTKSLKDAFQDLSIAVVDKFLQNPERPQVFLYHRRDGNAELLGAIIKAFKDDNILKIVTAGEDSGPGIMIIHGPEELVRSIAPRVCEIVEGKGGGKARFTAKVSKLGRRGEMEKFVLDYLSRNQSSNA